MKRFFLSIPLIFLAAFYLTGTRAADTPVIKFPGPISAVSKTAPDTPPGHVEIPQGGTKAEDLAITTANGQPINVSASKPSEVVLSIKNLSEHALTITHFSFNFPALFVPLSIALPAGKSTELPLLIDGRLLSFPAQLPIMFRIRDDKGGESVHTSSLSLTSKEVFILEPRGAVWKVGDPAKPKSIRITQTPEGAKITGVKVSSDQFTIKLAGDTITITPIDTTKPSQASIFISTNPASRMPLSIPALIVSPPSAPSAPKA